VTGVALLHYSCPPVVGGVEEVLRQQAQVLAQHGHEVRVIAGEGGTSDGGVALARGSITVRIHPLLASGAAEAVEAQRSGSTEDLLRVTADVEVVLDEALDGCAVLVAHNVLSMPFNLPLALALRRLAERSPGGAPAVVGWNHDSPYFYPGYDRALDDHPWKVLRDPHPGIHWVTISDTRAGEFAALYAGARPRVIPNGIDPASFLKLEASISALVREERLLDADLVLVQPSRLHPRKNTELSLAVLAALRRRGLDARLLVTGAADPHDPVAAGYAQRLQDVAAELAVTDAVIVLAGHTLADGGTMMASRLAIRDLFQVADVLFLPSLSEGFGLPVLEAGLIRLPVACADIPSLREVAGDEAYRFPLDHPPDLIAEELLAYLDRIPTHRLYRRVIPEHTWEHIYRVHLRPLLSELAG
jgi:mannosylglucosylglycerate synthase